MSKPAAWCAVLPWLLVAGVGVSPSGELELSGGYTLVGQKATDDRLRDSTTGSADFYLGWVRERGRLDVYVEGNSSLKSRGVATVLAESNADAGTALDPDRNGRIQLSELKYGFFLKSERRLTLGLLDPSAYIDATRINNDENMQFLGAPFVNNPTIEFPDYSLGLSYRHPSRGRGPSWNLVATGSNGIADNPNLSYSQLLNVTDAGKGVFAAAEAAWPRERHLLRTGAWVNTARHTKLGDGEEDAYNYGVYSATGIRRGRTAANLRLGLAHRRVSLAAGFAAVGLQIDWGRPVLGLAVGRTWLSSKTTLEAADDSTHLEVYLRVRVVGELYLTPSIQHLRNSQFDSSGLLHDDVVTVYSLRIHQSF